MVGRFAGLIAILWIALFAVWQSLPYVRSGSAIVYAAKEAQEREGRVFPVRIPRSSRLIVFGNSKVLTGFIPSVFDSALPGVYSANMGKPDASHFAADLGFLARHDQLPQRVLLTLPWSTGSPSPRDDQLVDQLFPFRRLPRDLILFSALAPGHGGMAAFYRHGSQTVSRMEQDRGWYFIEGQSHYAGSRLPDDFRLPGDTPLIVDDPAFIAHGGEFERFNALAEKYRFEIYLVPSYHRTGELAPSPPYAEA